MNRKVTLRLEPAGHTIAAESGTRLQDLLFQEGVEFPCGGNGTCGKCRIRVIDGQVDATDEDVTLLGEETVAAGWRLACRGRLVHDAMVLLAQWDVPVLSDDTPVDVSPRNGLGIAIDLGTTTVAAQLLDLESGKVLGVRTGLNPQAACGADIMSRIHYAVSNGTERLTNLIRQFVGTVVRDLIAASNAAGHTEKPLLEVVLVGNTVMHHLFAGYEVNSLARSPFQSSQLEEAVFSPAELKWDLPESCQVCFLPCLGGFVGSDVLAGIVATSLDRPAGLQALVDLGTNGEIVVTDGEQMLCAATAAGPAFEGARIRMGMRATFGAIDRIGIAEDCNGHALECHVIGGGQPQGVCGSGLIDAASRALELGLLSHSGRLTGGTDQLPLAGKVFLHQCDIRELQLAKGAIAAGVELLLGRLKTTIGEVDQVYLAGAFGNYLDVENSRLLGLLPFAADKIHAMGNTALLGAKIILLSGEESRCRLADICSKVEHVSINEDPSFMDVYVGHMPFPNSSL